MGIDRSLFLDEVPGDCLCSICQEVLEDPKETLTCQHAFCYDCITQWMCERSSCPTCRCLLSHGDIVSLHRIWREKLNKLRVRCHNFRIGCEAVVQLQHLDKHLQECAYVCITCPHSPCGSLVQRAKLPAHLESCDYRRVTCPECALDVPATEFAGHRCVQSLRDDLQQKTEILRHEWLDCLRTMRREQRRLEERIQQQELEISELKSSLSSLSPYRRHHHTVPHLPAIKVSGSSVRVNSRSNAGQLARSHALPSSRRNSQTGSVNLSLPRLPPLHTHMTLSRNSGRLSGIYTSNNQLTK